MDATENWRDLTEDERGLIEKLLSPAFPGRDALLSQLKSASAVTALDDGTLDLQVAPDAPRAAVTSRVPVEGQTRDADGIAILILLHVVNGHLHELEIVRGDDGPILRPPRASALSVVVRP